MTERCAKCGGSRGKDQGTGYCACPVAPERRGLDFAKTPFLMPMRQEQDELQRQHAALVEQAVKEERMRWIAILRANVSKSVGKRLASQLDTPELEAR